MFHQNDQYITFYDIKLGLQGSFYDIVFPQKRFSLPETKIKKYEQDNMVYMKYVAKHFPYQIRNPTCSIYNICFDKWNHFCFFPNSSIYTTIVNLNIIPSSIVTHKKPKEELILVFSSTTTNDSGDRDIIRYIVSRIFGFALVHQHGFLFINEKYQISYKAQQYNKIKLDNIVTEITLLKKNKFSIYNGLQIDDKKYLPNLSDSSVFHSKDKMNDCIKYGEISLLFNCGSAIRNKAHSLGIYSFHDSRFLSCLSFKTSKIVKRILDINSSTTDWKYVDPSIKENPNYQRLVKAYKENNILYFDLEFVKDCIYLGGFSDNNEEYEYLWNDRSNKAFMIELINYLDLYKDKIIVYYCAELRKLREYVRKLNITVDNNFFDNFVDLYVLLKDFCAFKGAYNFKLKNVEKALSTYVNLQSSTYENLECQNGVDSIEMFEEFKLFRKTNIKRQIIEYNSVDCYNMKTIVEAILNNECLIK
jgi:uncharacterized protein YprB with RNaseH-like and TPR domain